MKTIAANLTPGDVSINGVKFMAGVVPEMFYEVLGNPSRILSVGPPAPYGHRNNQRHIFDDYGICLIEHHARCTIDGIDFLFVPYGTALAPEHMFQGELSIAGSKFDPSLDLRQYLKVAPLPFTKHLSTWYHYDGERISITLTTFSRGKTKSGRPTFVRGISCVSADFLDRGQPRQSTKRDVDEPNTVAEEVARLATDIVRVRTTRGVV